MTNIVMGGSWATAKKEYISPEYPFTGCTSSGVGFRLLRLEEDVMQKYKPIKGGSWLIKYRRRKTYTNTMRSKINCIIDCGFRVLKEAK